ARGARGERGGRPHPSRKPRSAACPWRGSYGRATLSPVLGSVTAVLALALFSVAGGAQGAGGTQVSQITLTMSDGAKLACSTTIPGGIPITPRPGVILFHGLGGKHQDMEPIAEQFFAPAGYETLECDARGHGTSEGLFGLD